MKSIFYSLLVFLSLVLISCSDITTNTMFDTNGGGNVSVSINTYELVSFSKTLDNMDETIESKENNNINLSSLATYLDRPVDTTTSLYAWAGQNYFNSFTKAEQDLAKNVTVRISNHYQEDTLMLFFNSPFQTNQERTQIVNILYKTLGQSMDTGVQNKTNTEETQELDIDIKKGILSIKEYDLQLKSDTLNMENKEFGNLFKLGGYRFIYNLPGEILEISNEKYQKLDDRTLEYYVPFEDIAGSNKLEGCVVKFVPTEPITDPKFTEVWEPEPAEVLFNKSNIPSDAIILFDGSSTSQWEDSNGNPIKWKVDNGTLVVNPGSGPIFTKDKWGDIQLHIEWKSPDEPRKEGQEKGNSGIFFQKRYEVQVLNSYRNRTYSNGQAAAVYKQHIPLVNATKPTGEWNVYDIVYRAPKYDSNGIRTKKGNVTVLHNGVIVQDHVDIEGTVEYIGLPKVIPHGDDQIMLQDHSNKVAYRNIWIRKL